MPTIPLRALEEDLARLAGLLARAERGDLPPARALVSAMRRRLRARQPDPVDPGQERLRLPMASDALVVDCPLGCPVSALVCTARQLLSEQEIGSSVRAKRRSSPAKRGRTPTRPSCVTARCSVGAVVRERHGDTDEAKAMALRAPRAADTSEA